MAFVPTSFISWATATVVQLRQASEFASVRNTGTRPFHVTSGLALLGVARILGCGDRVRPMVHHRRRLTLAR